MIVGERHAAQFCNLPTGLIAERCQNISFFGGRKGTGKLDRGDYRSAHISADFSLDYRARI